MTTVKSAAWAGAVALGLLGTMPDKASAATYVLDSQTFAYDAQLAVGNEAFGADPYLVYSSVATSRRPALAFAGFDTRLGNLQSAHIVMTSVQTITGGVSVTSPDGIVGGLAVARPAYTSSLKIGQITYGTHDGDTLVDPDDPDDPDDSVSLSPTCFPSRVSCIDFQRKAAPFDLDFRTGDLTPFLNPQVQVELPFDLLMPFHFLSNSPSTIDTAAAGFSWTGDLRISYRYTPFDGPVEGPAGVPEPAAWALMIAGFGLTGLRLRDRRRTPRCAGSSAG